THAVGLGALVVSALQLTPRLGVNLNTIDRFFSTPHASTGIGSGRLELAVDALGAIADHSFIGVGSSGFHHMYGAAPHVAALNFATSAGLAVGVIVAAMCVSLVVHIMLRRPAEERLSAHMIIAVYVAAFSLQ